MQLVSVTELLQSWRHHNKGSIFSNKTTDIENTLDLRISK